MTGAAWLTSILHPSDLSLDSGQINLNRILIPVSRVPNPTVAITYGRRVAQWAKSVTEISLLHIGEEDYPWPQTPEQSGILWQPQIRQGTVVEQIIEVSEEERADLMIMTTQSHHGIWDALRGSTTEQVLR